MEALALSEFYGFARLGFLPNDITISEEELQKKYCSHNMRVPEFIAGNQMVEVKRLKLEFDIAQIVKKACEKAHYSLVCNEKVYIFHICYALPCSTNDMQLKLMQKKVKAHTIEYSSKVYAKILNIVFTKVPDICFEF